MQISRRQERDRWPPAFAGIAVWRGLSESWRLLCDPQFFRLYGNYIGDGGVEAVAGAVASMPCLEKLKCVFSCVGVFALVGLMGVRTRDGACGETGRVERVWCWERGAWETESGGVG